MAKKKLDDLLDKHSKQGNGSLPKQNYNPLSIPDNKQVTKSSTTQEGPKQAKPVQHIDNGLLSPLMNEMNYD